MPTIPEPTNLFKGNIPTLTALKDLMKETHTHGQFWAFQLLMRKIFYPLPGNKYSHQQDPKEWQTCVEKLLSHDQKLSRYDGLWPIRLTWDHRVAHPRRLNKRPKSLRPPPPLLSASNQPKATTLPKKSATIKRRLFVGKPPPDLKKDAVVLWFGSLTPALLGRRLDNLWNDESDDELTIGPCSEIPWPRASTLPSTPPRMPEPLDIHRVPVGCYDCGRPMGQEYVGSMVSIIATFGNNPEHVKALFEGGLIDDRHLTLFLQWAPVGQRVFIALLETSNFVKEALTHRLIHSVGCASSPASEGRKAQARCGEATTAIDLPTGSGQQRVISIPQPNDAEEYLTDPKVPDTPLFQAMRLGQNRELFEELLMIVWECALSNYALAFRPTKEQFEKTVEEISKKKLLFGQYENQWPIRFMLKRFARTLGCRPLDGHLELSTQQQQHATTTDVLRSKSRAFSGLPSSLNHSALPHIQYTCPQHPGVDVNRVSDDVKRLLHHRGLSEFIPVFASAAIRSVADLQLFCEFSDEKKDEALGKGKAVKLNIFQQVALKLEFTVGNMGPFPP